MRFKQNNKSFKNRIKNLENEMKKVWKRKKSQRMNKKKEKWHKRKPRIMKIFYLGLWTFIFCYTSHKCFLILLLLCKLTFNLITIFANCKLSQLFIIQAWTWKTYLVNINICAFLSCKNMLSLTLKNWSWGKGPVDHCWW